MVIRFSHVLAIAVLAANAALCAEEPRGGVPQHALSPELLLRHRDTFRLTDEPVVKIQAIIEDTQSTAADFERKVAVTKSPGVARLSHEAVVAQVAGLKKDDVAWRKIHWKTCLINGLNASRQQNKPLILWIFIDRPSDDERC